MCVKTLRTKRQRRGYYGVKEHVDISTRLPVQQFPAVALANAREEGVDLIFVDLETDVRRVVKSTASFTSIDPTTGKTCRPSEHGASTPACTASASDRIPLSWPGWKSDGGTSTTSGDCVLAPAATEEEPAAGNCVDSGLLVLQLRLSLLLARLLGRRRLPALSPWPQFRLPSRSRTRCILVQACCTGAGLLASIGFGFDYQRGKARVQV